MAPKLRSKSLSGRTHRAKSLPASRLDSALSPIKSPRKPKQFSPGRIIPSDVSICKACKTPILKTPPPAPTPKLSRPARSHLEGVLQTSLLEAHSRTVGIQTLYVSASSDYRALENKDRTDAKLDFLEHTLEPEWRHAPYTEEICKVMGTLYGELGRALATSQKTVIMLHSLLGTERLRLQAGISGEQEWLSMEEENKWFEAQHYARYLASLPKKRCYIFTTRQMAGSIAYVSFPRFTRTRQSIMATMCRRLLETLLTLSGTGSCFLGPRKVLENESPSQDNLQKSTASASGKPVATTRPEHDRSAANHQVAANPSQTNPPKDHIPNLHALTRQPSSSYSSTSSSSNSPPSSLRSASSALRASLNRHISWQTNCSDQWTTEPTSNEAQASTPTEGAATITSETDNDDLIASLDALALSQHERELLSRMQLVCQSARAARERRVGRQDWSGGDGIRGDGIYGVEPGLRLRGGASSPVRHLRTPRRRTTLPVEDPVLPRPDSARPPRGLWWLAGGGEGKVPTLGELRVRKEVERANRRIVGFWGTVLGVRRVGRVGILDGEGDEGDAGSSHGSESVGSVMGTSGAGGGGSLVSSHRGREVEVDQPVEAKAESVADADNNPDQPTASSLNCTAEDHGSTKSGDVTADVEEPKASSESAKRVAEDHGSTKTGGIENAGVEEPKARSESTKSVAGDTGTAEVESVRSREGVAETVEEDNARSSNDD